MMNLFSRIAKSARDVWDNRIILLAMIRRSTAGRYKNSYLGFAWHLLTPILMIIVFYITFTSIRPRPIPDFWIFLSSGVFPVSFLSASLRGRSIVANANYITKMKFPREIAVIASVITDFLPVLFAYNLIVIAILLAGQPVNWFGMAMIPVLLVLMLVFCIGCSFLVSTVTVFVKDVGFFMSAIMRLVYWVTPTFFMLSDATGLLKDIVTYNPFTYFVEVFHDILYFGVFPHTDYLIICTILTVSFFLVGSWVFFRYEKRFPEVL